MSLRAVLRTPDGAPLVDLALDDLLAMVDRARGVMLGAAAQDPAALEAVLSTRRAAVDPRLPIDVRRSNVLGMHLLHRAMGEMMAREIVEVGHARNDP